ncbi:MAG TPA: hypothetical protein VGP80_05685 [Gemmatimonadales bacterium]|nr:hypothetical protein [Gemmatimonadales bacterium]
MTRGNWFVRTSAVLAGLALAGTLTPRSAQAQGITFTPYVGSFYGLTKMFDSDVDLAVFGGSGTARFTVEQTNTVMFGARIGVPISSTISIEGQAGYLSSDVRLVGKDAIAQGLDLSTNLTGNVITGSVRAAYRPRRSNLSLIGGIAAVHHGGDAWDFPVNEKLTNIGGVVGFSLRAAVTPRFALVINAETFVYSFDPDKSNDTSQGFLKKTTQADLVVSIGVPISLTH